MNAMYPSARHKFIPHSGQTHYFCPRCDERLARQKDDLFRFDGGGWQQDQSDGHWERDKRHPFKGQPRGKDARRAFGPVHPGDPTYEYAEQAMERYTHRRRPTSPNVPPGENVVMCPGCGAKCLVTSRVGPDAT